MSDTVSKKAPSRPELGCDPDAFPALATERTGINWSRQSLWYLASAAGRSLSTERTRSFTCRDNSSFLLSHTSKIDSLKVFSPAVTLSTVRHSTTRRHRLGCLGSFSMTHSSPQNMQCFLKLKRMGVSDRRERFACGMSSLAATDEGRFEERFKCSVDT